MAMVQKTMNQRAINMPMGRMNNNPWGFRQDDNVLILEENLKFKFLRNKR